MKRIFPAVLLLSVAAISACGADKKEEGKEKTEKNSAAENTEEPKEEPQEQGPLEAIYPTTGFMTYCTEGEVTEYIFVSMTNGDFIYYSTKANKGVKLQVVDSNDAGMIVQFPGKPEKYTLQIADNPEETDVPVICINPDGSRQAFVRPLHTGCFHTADFNHAFISAGPPIAYVYFNSDYPNGILTDISGGSNETGQFRLEIPGTKKHINITGETESTLTAKMASGETLEFTRQN
jgi:hypothetical protein